MQSSTEYRNGTKLVCAASDFILTSPAMYDDRDRVFLPAPTAALSLQSPWQLLHGDHFVH